MQQIVKKTTAYWEITVKLRMLLIQIVYIWYYKLFWKHLCMHGFHFFYQTLLSIHPSWVLLFCLFAYRTADNTSSYSSSSLTSSCHAKSVPRSTLSPPEPTEPGATAGPATTPKTPRSSNAFSRLFHSPKLKCVDNRVIFLEFAISLF